MRTRGRKSRGRRGRKREPQRAAEEGGGEDIPASRAEHSRVVRSRESRGAEQSHGGWSGIWSRTGLESQTERTVGVTVEWSSRCAEQSRADGRPRAARTDSRGAVACATAAAGLEVRRRPLLFLPLLPFPLPLSLSQSRWGFRAFDGSCRRGAADFLASSSARRRSFPVHFHPAASASARRTTRQRLRPQGDAIHQEDVATPTPGFKTRSDD
jgi:hypothetical protein